MACSSAWTKPGKEEEDEAGRLNHLHGPIAQALLALAPNLLAAPPVIERADVLGAKLPV